MRLISGCGLTLCICTYSVSLSCSLGAVFMNVTFDCMHFITSSLPLPPRCVRYTVYVKQLAPTETYTCTLAHKITQESLKQCIIILGRLKECNTSSQNNSRIIKTMYNYTWEVKRMQPVHNMYTSSQNNPRIIKTMYNYTWEVKRTQPANTA